jgi:Uma2 family endonuclease
MYRNDFIGGVLVMADAPLEKTAITLDDLMSISERVEIIDGEMIEMTAAGIAHQLIVSNIFRALDAYVIAHDSGAVFPDGLTYLMRSPSSGLKDSYVPDVSFIRKANIPHDLDPEKPHPGVPDLAVEVISPSEGADQVQRKVRTYLDKGTEQVWIVYPTARELHQFHRDSDTVRIYKGSQTIETETLFPELQLTTNVVFHLPDWAVKDS